MTEILPIKDEEQPLVDIGPDAYFDMSLRKALSGFAEQRVDFYREGMTLILDNLPTDRPITDQDILLDVGCSTNEFLAEAMMARAVPGRGVGLDVQTDAYNNFAPQDLDRFRFPLICGRAEAMPFANNIARALLANNVMFRGDYTMMLQEFKRVVEPGGIIAISTNYPDHAPLRHGETQQIAEEFGWKNLLNMPMRGIKYTIPKPPADSIYFENLKAILAEDRGFEIVGKPVEQNTFAKVTPEVLDIFEYSLMCSANYTGMPDYMRPNWRRAVEGRVNMLRQEIENKRLAGKDPWIMETIHRGLIAVRNLKANPGKIALSGTVLG